MSPNRFYGTSARLLYVTARGKLHYGNDNVSATYGLRPVINLKADTKFSGSGSSTDPYVVV